MFYRQSRANLGYVAILSNAEKFRCLYSYYGSCMLHALFSKGVYTPLALIGPNKVACAPGVV